MAHVANHFEIFTYRDIAPNQFEEVATRLHTFFRPMVEAQIGKQRLRIKFGTRRIVALKKFGGKFGFCPPKSTFFSLLSFRNFRDQRLPNGLHGLHRFVSAARFPEVF